MRQKLINESVSQRCFLQWGEKKDERTHLSVLEPSNLLKLHLELAHKLSLVRVVPVAPVAMLVLGLLLEKLLETFVVEVLVFGSWGEKKSGWGQLEGGVGKREGAAVSRTEAEAGDCGSWKRWQNRLGARPRSNQSSEHARSWTSRWPSCRGVEGGQGGGGRKLNRRGAETHVDLPLWVERALDPLSELL